MLCIRTMALPIGRGMVTMFASTPVLTEPFPVPKLNLSGKAPPRGTTVELANIEVPTNMDNWPHFHNGVAAGLKVCTTFISLSVFFFIITLLVTINHMGAFKTTCFIWLLSTLLILCIKNGKYHRRMNVYLFF